MTNTSTSLVLSEKKKLSRKIKHADTKRAPNSALCTQQNLANVIQIRVDDHVNVSRHSRLMPNQRAIVLQIVTQQDMRRVELVFPKTKSLMRAWFDFADIVPVTSWEGNALHAAQVASREDRRRQCATPGGNLITVDERLF